MTTRSNAHHRTGPAARVAQVAALTALSNAHHRTGPADHVAWVVS